MFSATNLTSPRSPRPETSHIQRPTPRSPPKSPTKSPLKPQLTPTKDKELEPTPIVVDEKPIKKVPDAIQNPPTKEK